MKDKFGITLEAAIAKFRGSHFEQTPKLVNGVWVLTYRSSQGTQTNRAWRPRNRYAVIREDGCVDSDDNRGDAINRAGDWSAKSKGSVLTLKQQVTYKAAVETNGTVGTGVDVSTVAGRMGVPYSVAFQRLNSLAKIGILVKDEAGERFAPVRFSLIKSVR